MTKRELATAIRLSLIGGLLSTPVIAQDQDEDTAELDRLEVTGSRIKRADIESASPVFVIQREEIERTGLTSVGDLLQDLPIAGSALNTNFNNGGNGETRLDLRNLGSNRLLVLLNGRRFVTDLNGFVDLNNIPVAVIKRIEILKDGASAIYGSDAISGVVNIITRDDFEGLQANAYFGQFESENDGEIQAYDFSVGTTSDRGSVFFSASYTKAEDVFAGNRRISQEPQFGTGNAFGSSGTPQGRFGATALGSTTLTTDPGAAVCGPAGCDPAAFREGDFSSGSPGDGDDRFNFAPDNYLLTPQERTNIFTQGTYDVTDDIRMTVEATYNNRESDQLLAPTPLFLGQFGSNLAANVGVGANNPFNPFGFELAASSWLLGRRLIEAGPRNFNQEVDSYRFGLGLEGSFEAFDRYFDWDMNYVYGKIERNNINFGLLNVQRVQESLSDGCVTNPNCVPLNVFGGIPGNTNPQAGDPGSITQEMVNYITFVANESLGNEITNYSANLTGELFEIPAGPLAFAAGYEYREEQGFDQPDALVSAGITSGNSRQPTSGSFSVDEFYIELAVPILAGVSFAERLDFSVAGRYSDYDTFGDTNNFKAGIEWQPIDDLLLRATYSEGFRAPAIGELFAGQTDSFPTITDPCSDMLGLQDPTAAQPGNVVNNCISQGVPADGSYVQANPQIRITVGSNPNLQPETSESVTFGIVYSPSWLDGLDITVDYYNIELDNAIGAVGSQTILNSCANSLQLCSLIQRGGIGQITDVLAAGVNVSSLEVEGVDFLVSYAFPETEWGFFRAVWDGAYQGKNEQSAPDFGNADPNAPPINTNFLGFNLGDTVFTRWKSNLDLNWSYGDWEATWGMQYIHGSGETCAIPAAFGFCNLDRDGDGSNEARKIGSLVYHDVQLSYHLSAYDTRITAGVQNLGDKGPPLSTTAFANSFNAADYRVPGRFPYVRVTVDF
ncbi:MAG: TonB-dependent receptor [Pseudomonadota bacterium]